MNAKLAACLVVLVLLAGSLVWLVAGGRGGAGRGRGADAAPPAPPTAETALAAPETLDDERALAAAREAARAPAAPAPEPASRARLAGLVGRVVESDGTPVRGMRVSLLEADASLIFDGTDVDAAPPALELEETVTDREGRFALGGARAGSFHALGIDLGGPRATLRIVDHALVHGERTDVGDVVLAPYGVVTGRVVDAAGAPVAGARVRLAPLPPEVLTATPYEFRADSLVAVGMGMMGGEGHVVLEPPGWVAAALQRFPVPTTYSAADGTFRLEGVALATLVGGIDKAGHLGIPLGPLDLTDGEEELGDLVLGRGRTVRGVVEDAFGEPAAGAEVHAGAEVVPGIAAILQPCGTTDEDGRFELTGVAESGQVVAAARRSRHEPWTTVVAADHERVLVEVPGVVPLAVNLRDPSGEPVRGARVQVVPVRDSADAWGIDQALVFLPRSRSAPEVFREVEPGRYAAAGLTTGVYDVLARAEGLAPGLVRTECFGVANEVTLVLSQGFALDLTVVDAATQAPVAGAVASVLRVGSLGLAKLATASTDAAGSARLGPLSDAPSVATAPSFIPEETVLRVTHPSYGDHSAPLPERTETLVVELRGGGALAGRVHWGGAVPTRPYMLLVEHRSGDDGFVQAFHTPRFGLTDLEGAFRLRNLQPGKHTVELVERFLDEDPLLRIVQDDFDAATLHREEIEIREGETTELVIDLTPTGRGATARVRGQVRLFGRNLAGAEVRVNGNESVRVETDEYGRFETADLSVRGSTWIVVSGDVPLAGGRTRNVQLHQETVELEHGDVHELVLDVHPLVLRVAAVDERTGAPVERAHVSVRREPRSGNSPGDGDETGPAGETELVVVAPGEHMVSAEAEGYGMASVKLTVPPEGVTGVTTLRMAHAVACAGRIDVAPGDLGAGEGPRFAWIQVRAAEGGVGSGALVRPPEYTFELDGLVPGEYRHWIYVNGQRGEEGKFTLGADGATDLVFTFVPGRE